MDDLKITGLWWLPSAPKNQVGGTLSFDVERGPILKLIGALGGVNAVQGQADIGTLFGIADNKVVTLEGCHTRQLTIAYPGAHKHTLGARRIFVGAHIVDDSQAFNAIDVSFDYLPEFINHSTLSGSIQSDKTGKKWQGVKAQVDTQKPIKIGPVPGGKISAKFGWGQSQERFRSLTLKETCALSVELDNAVELNKIISEYVRPLQNLVTLATDRPNTITKLSVQSTQIVDSYTSKPIQVDVYQVTNAIPKKSQDKSSLLRHDMLFTLGDLKRSKINSWLKIADYYQPAIGILFGQRYVKVGLENQLLNVVSALEAYHRRRFKNSVLKKDLWKAKKKRMVEKVDQADAAFLNNLLQYANEKRLKTRIDEVLENSGISKDMISDPEEWNKRIRGYRNSLTHYDPSSPQEITDYESVYWLAESLAWVLLACFMVETGFSRRETLELVKKNQRYIFLKQRLGEILVVL